jgi:thiol:disulfide interchange protein
MIGKITEVNDTSYVIDYGHSSGFTPLTCEVVFKPFASPDGLRWLQDMDAAKNESRQSGKPLLIHFHDQWSGPNRKLISEVLPAPRVVAALGGYIRVQVNTTANISMLQEYGITTIPSILILNSEGKELQRFIDVPKTDELADELGKIVAEKE